MREGRKKFKARGNEEEREGRKDGGRAERGGIETKKGQREDFHT